MFKHGKTNYVYYSVNEKIKHYNNILKTGKTFDGKVLTASRREYAESRLEYLNSLKNRSFNDPDLIMTNDNHFGNAISKPRVCAVIDTDKKGRVLVAPVEKRTTKTIILDNDYERQIGNKRTWIDRSEIYEVDRYITNVAHLSNNDMAKIKYILRKK